MHLVMITPIAPSSRRQESAGEVLASDILGRLIDLGDVSVVTAPCAANTRAQERGVEATVAFIPPRRPTRFDKFVSIIPMTTAQGLREAEDSIKRADIIDIQWEEQAVFIPEIRRINATARIFVTLHDVLSQRYRRLAEQSSSMVRSTRWHLRSLMARRLEHHIMNEADNVLVLSDKDAALLPPGGAEVSVIHPHIRGTVTPRPSQQTQPSKSLLFVGLMLRQENQDAMRWFANEILPDVKLAHPDVQVLIAGAGAPDSFVAEMGASGVQVLGYVDDLDPLYAEAAATVTPLRLGAGVKFKTIDAIVRGVPVISTSVGAEGVADPRWFKIVDDDPAKLASAVIDVLDAPSQARFAALQHAGAAQDYYSEASFRRSLPSQYQGSAR